MMLDGPRRASDSPCSTAWPWSPGSAVASVHVRLAIPEAAGPAEWAWAWCLFTWLTLTSAGPYVFLVRRFFTRPTGYPKLGDQLWALAGLPWLLAAMVRSGEPPGDAVTGHLDPAYRRLPQPWPGPVDPGEFALARGLDTSWATRPEGSRRPPPGPTGSAWP